MGYPLSSTNFNKMHIAYSAFSPYNDMTKEHNQFNQDSPLNEAVIRYHAYQDTCKKYSRQIASIQKYIPGWIPAFR